ncbi:lymphocyte antigen 96 [Eleutherodactylus coqui]|uniref:lymphocyte antigen 96 n=1 Tax=Eleutherodactylus coqui TaxID=57060 RepID=UPI003461A8E8
MCDDSFTPVAKMEPCELSKSKTLNLSLITIPRKNIDRLYGTAEAWKGSLSFSNRSFVLCSGADDEYDFCGVLKGETLKINVYDHKLRNLQLNKDRYTIKFRLFVGEQELLSCILLTANVKYTVML